MYRRCMLSYHYPPVRYDVRVLFLGFIKPLRGRDHPTTLSVAQPRAPPREGTVGDHSMLAQRHQVNVLGFSSGRNHGYIQTIEVLSYPIRVIREDEEPQTMFFIIQF